MKKLLLMLCMVLTASAIRAGKADTRPVIVTQTDGSKLTAFDKANTTDGLREAVIGRLLGFDVVVSPWMDNTKPMAIGLHKPSVAYVSQISEIESMRAQNTFADRVRGLHVYGGKVLRPTAVQVFKGV